jgi:Phosphopantetheine attachment site
MYHRTAPTSGVTFRNTREASLGPSWVEINKICREIFGRDVTPDDDFFKIGGDSISVALLITKLRLVNLNLPVFMVFETPNLGNLSERIDAIRFALSVGDDKGKSSAAEIGQTGF